MIPTIHKYITQNSFETFSLDDESVNLVVTSPPYPMIEMWDEILGNCNPEITQKIKNEEGIPAFELMHQLLDKTWSECFRILKPGGFACINIGDATRTIGSQFQLYSNHSRILQQCVALGFEVMPSIIWRKPTNSPTKFMGSGMLPAGAYVTLEHEWILILRKGGKRVFDKSETDLRRESAMFWEERNHWYSDQWSDILGTSQQLIGKAERQRSAAYPFEIPRRLIAMYSIYGDTVLDPFSGTGTTALAGIQLGRNTINFDTDRKMLAESAALPTKRQTKKILNEALMQRLIAHSEYVNSKDMLFFKYKNELINQPVKTLQEKKLYQYAIQSISKNDDGVIAKYRKWKGEELASIPVAWQN